MSIETTGPAAPPSSSRRSLPSSRDRLQVLEATGSDALPALSGQDLSFLAWESRERPMHLAVRADFECGPGTAPPSLDELRAVLDARTRRVPLLRSRLDRRIGPLRPRWRPVEELRIEDHVRREPDSARGPAVRRRRVDALLRRPLLADRPLWEVILLTDPLREDAFSLLIKVHHALVDGVGGMQLLERLLGEDAAGARRRRDGQPSGASAGAGSAKPTAGSTLRFAREQLRATPRTPLNGRPGTRRHHALASDARTLDALASARDVAANDVVLACVAGALRGWFRRETLAPPPSGLRAFCPVSLREPGERSLGNRIAPWLVPLFVDEADGEERLARIHEATSERKRSRAHRGGEGMARVVARLGAWVGRLGMALAARRRAYNVVVTNVPGPSRPVDFLGARLTGLVPFVPLFPGQRLAVAVVRHAGRLHWGVTEALDRPARGQRFVRELARELTELEQAGRELEALARDESA